MANNPFLLDIKPVGIWEESPERKRRPVDKNLRHIVWTKYNKSSLSGKCYACKTPITFQHFHVGHNKAVAEGGKDNINNLRPICSSCNNSMRTMSIEHYKAKYFGVKPVHKIKRTAKRIKQKPRNPFDIRIKPIRF